MIPPSSIFQSKLIALGKFTLPTTNGAWPLFAIAEPETPNQCATIYDTTPVRHGVCHQNGEILQHYGLQLKVRDPNYATGWAKINDIMVLLPTLVYISITVNSIAYRLHAAVPTSGVLPIGMDEKRRELFTLNFVAAIKEI